MSNLEIPIGSKWRNTIQDITRVVLKNDGHTITYTFQGFNLEFDMSVSEFIRYYRRIDMFEDELEQL